MSTKLRFKNHITGLVLSHQATVGPVPRVGEYVHIQIEHTPMGPYSCLKIVGVYYIYHKGWLDFVELECEVS